MSRARSAVSASSANSGMLSSHSISADTAPKRRAARSIERPHFVAHRMVVRIEQVGAVIAMPGEMVLHDALGRHRVDIVVGVEAMVERAHEDIVDVEQDSAVGFVRRSPR